MTRAQIRKLETILGKLEALQGEVKSAERDRLGTAKSELIRALQDAEAGER